MRGSTSIAMSPTWPPQVDCFNFPRCQSFSLVPSLAFISIFVFEPMLCHHCNYNACSGCMQHPCPAMRHLKAVFKWCIASYGNWCSHHSFPLEHQLFCIFARLHHLTLQFLLRHNKQPLQHCHCRLHLRWDASRRLAWWHGGVVCGHQVCNLSPLQLAFCCQTFFIFSFLAIWFSITSWKRKIPQQSTWELSWRQLLHGIRD